MPRKSKPIPIEAFRAAIDYDPDTGRLTWKPRQLSDFRSSQLHAMWTARHMGRSAGNVDEDGYVQIRLEGRRYAAHRVAWALMTGSEPACDIDHVNGDKSDNRWANLRDVDHWTNQQNRRRASVDAASGRLGVSKRCDRKKFRARIYADGRELHLGSFATADEAHAAYVEAKRRLHGGCTI